MNTHAVQPTVDSRIVPQSYPNISYSQAEFFNQAVIYPLFEPLTRVRQLRGRFAFSIKAPIFDGEREVLILHALCPIRFSQYFTHEYQVYIRPDKNQVIR